MPLPRSLGFVTVTTPGQPVPLSSGPLLALSARVQPRSAVANIGNIYIGNAGMNKNTGAGVYAILSPEQVEGFQFKELIDLGQVYEDADNAGDGCLASYAI